MKALCQNWGWKKRPQRKSLSPETKVKIIITKWSTLCNSNVNYFLELLCFAFTFFSFDSWEIFFSYYEKFTPTVTKARCWCAIYSTITEGRPERGSDYWMVQTIHSRVDPFKSFIQSMSGTHWHWVIFKGSVHLKNKKKSTKLSTGIRIANVELQ